MNEKNFPLKTNGKMHGGFRVVKIIKGNEYYKQRSISTTAFESNENRKYSHKIFLAAAIRVVFCVAMEL